MLKQLHKIEKNKERETVFKVRYVYDYSLKKKKCQECRKKLTGKQVNWCSRECGNKFFNRFYWKRIRYDVWTRDNKKCVKCKTYLPYSNGIQIDHITRIADGGKIFTMENYQLLCLGCHKAKTSKENKGYTREQRTITEFI